MAVRTTTLALCLLATAFGSEPVCASDAGEDEQPREDIVVYGRGEHRIGEAVAASEGAIARADLIDRPLLRPAEVLEAVPGLIASQHSGGGKANQYFLRGFNLDHGTDFALSIDDMPMNFRTHGHGQGYLDVGGLIPESVERIDYRKGPYRGASGDFSFVGAALMHTVDRLDPFATAELGEFGYRRLVSGGSVRAGGGDLLLLGQWKAFDGPWELPERLRSASGLLKYSGPLGAGDFSASLNIYSARWRPTEQIPERAIGTLLADAYGTLDPTLTGRTDRQVVTLGYKDPATRVTLWGQHYDWSLFSNFTFFLDDPVNGDQLRQYETMWGAGGRIEHDVALAGTLQLNLGGEFRHDHVSLIGLDHSAAGVVLAARSRFSVRETSGAFYSELTWRPAASVMITGALRGDLYRFSTRALAGSAWSGQRTDGLVTPKIGANVEVRPGLAFYANYGAGFHSNDARGVTEPVSPAPGLVRGHFIEGGLRYEVGNLVITANHWWSRIGSELIYVGDSGSVEPSGVGKRRGYELTAFWRPRPWLAVDAVWTAAHSRFADLPAGANRIPSALENSGEIGLSITRQRWNAALRVRHLGPHALIEDNSQRGESTNLVNLRLAVNAGRLELFADLLNLFDIKAHDVDYFYVTRLPDEPLAGIEGRNSRVVEPRQLRVGLKARL